MKHTKAIYCQIFVFLYFYFKNFEFFSKQNIWYDDAHELLISKVSIFDPLTFIRVADHHLGFSIVLKIVLSIVGIKYIYLVLSFIFISLFCSIGYILSRKFDNSISILLVQIIFLTSSTFINYSFRPKQYVYDFLIVVALIYFLDNYKYSLIKLIMLTICCFIFSNILIIYFIYPIFQQLRKQNLNYKNVIYLVVLIPFGVNSFLKITNINFNSYWNDFYSNNIFDIERFFYNSILFLRSFLDLGYLFIVFLVIFSGVIILFKNNKNLFFLNTIPLFIILFLNLLNIYPLGGGRTDIILFPFIFYSIYYLLASCKKEFFINTLAVVFIVYVSFTNLDTQNEKVDNTKFVLNEIDIEKFDKVFISFYSIPQVALHSQDIIELKFENNKCLYRSKNKKIVLLSKTNDNSCIPENNLNKLETSITKKENIAVLGFDSNTQNIQKYIKNLDFTDFRTEVKKFGNQEFLFKAYSSG